MRAAWHAGLKPERGEESNYVSKVGRWLLLKRLIKE